MQNGRSRRCISWFVSVLQTHSLLSRMLECSRHSRCVKSAIILAVRCKSLDTSPAARVKDDGVCNCEALCWPYAEPKFECAKLPAAAEAATAASGEGPLPYFATKVDEPLTPPPERATELDPPTASTIAKKSFVRSTAIGARQSDRAKEGVAKAVPGGTFCAMR